MKRFTAAAALALSLAPLLVGCPSAPSGQPPTQAQIQQNAATVLYWLQYAGCVASTLGVAAAPIVTVAADAQGQQVLAATEAATGKVCTTTVPPSALPAPVAPSTPAIPVPVSAMKPIA